MHEEGKQESAPLLIRQAYDLLNAQRTKFIAEMGQHRLLLLTTTHSHPEPRT
jgi:hypothetical protein